MSKTPPPHPALAGPASNQLAIFELLQHRVSAGASPRDVWSPNYVPLRRRGGGGAGPSRSQGATAATSSVPAKTAGPPGDMPPGCPMHKSGTDAMSSSPFSRPKKALVSSSSPSSSSSSSLREDDSQPSGSTSKSFAASLNPLNYMPSLSQARESVKQTVELSTERVTSSIPRSHSSAPAGASPYDAPASSSEGASSCPVKHDGNGAGAGREAEASNWEYPSPQQFYNALVRKGWETPEEHVEMMVLVHNFLNEEAWKQVLEWEEKCGRDSKSTSLVKFQGRPGTLSPKARLYSYLGVIAPSTYSSEPPFDRHDWVVRSSSKAAASSPSSSAATQADQRYVIDYYSGPDDPETGDPVFHLDIRPALDSPAAAWHRIKATWEDYRKGATGAAEVKAA